MAELGDGALREELAGETRTLRLGLADLERIEKLTGRGIYALGADFFNTDARGVHSLRNSSITLSQVRSVLLAALAGGGMEIGAAERLAADAMAAPMKAMLVARAILGVALMPETVERAEKKTPENPRTN